MFQQSQPLLPEDDGVLSGTPTPDNLIQLGASLAAASAQILIGAEPDSAFSGAAAGILAGACAAAGSSAVLVPCATLPELSAASIAADLPLLVHLAEHRLRVFAKGMLPLTAAWQTLLCDQPQAEWCAPSQYGEVLNGSGLTSLFSARIRERLPDSFPVLPEITTGSAPLYRKMAQLLRGGRGQLLTIQLSSDGRKLALYHTDCGWIFHEKVLLLVCQQYFVQGKDVALPYWMPRAAEDMARKYGRNVLRYASCSDGTDNIARALALAQGFTLDAAILCAEFLRLLSEHRMSLKEWLRCLPPCHTVHRIVRLDVRGGNSLQTWQANVNAAQTAEGYFAEDARGRVLVRPSRTGKTAALFAEADSIETASELAGDICARLGDG